MPIRAIAKVEPLTTARALRGPFDYLLPERLGDVGVGTVLRVPFGRRRILGVVVELAERRPRRRSGSPSRSRRSRPGRRRSWSSSASGCARVLLDPGARARAGAAAGHRARRGPTAAPRHELRAAPDRRRRPRGSPAIGRRQRLGARSSSRAAASCAAPAAAARGRRRDACGGSSAAAWSELGAPRSSGARRRSGRRPAARGGSTAAQRRGGADRRRPRRRGRASCLLHGVTGSGKTEVYLAAPRRRSSGAGRDRARPRDRADAADRVAVRAALRRSGRDPPLGAAAGRAPRRVAAAAPRRGADLRRAALGRLRAGRATWG